MIINFSNLGGGGGGGTTNYNQLSNKPQINAVTLSGNTSLDTLDIAHKSELVSGDLMVGLTKNIYSPTGTKTEGTFTERTTAENISVSTGIAQLKKVAANTLTKTPVYDGFAVSVTDGHLTASSTGTTDASYSGATYTYGATGWTPSLESFITTMGTAINGDVITTVIGDVTQSAYTIVNYSFADPSVSVTINPIGGSRGTSINWVKWTLNKKTGASKSYYSGTEEESHSGGGGTSTASLAEVEGYYGFSVTNWENLTIGDYFEARKVYPINVTVTEASRENHLTVAVDEDTFREEHPTSGTYNFTYTNSAWNPSLGEAISITGTPLEGDKITVVSTTKDYGTLSSATPTAFWATSMNVFNKDDASSYEVNKTIDGEGNVVASEGSYLVKIDAIPTDDGYVAYSEVNGLIRIGIASSATATTVDLSGATQNSEVSICTPTSEKPYVYVATSDIAHLCIHPQWSGYNNKVYEAYSLDTLSIPTTDISGNTLPPFIAVGNLRNEYDFVNKTYTQNVESITATEELIQQYRTTKVWGTDYVFDENHIYQKLATPVVYNLEEQDYTYNESDFGWEGFSGTTVPVVASSIYYMDNLVDKLRRDVITKDELVIDRVEAVESLPTTGVSAGTVYNYDGNLYKYVTTSGYCGEWFGYTNLNNTNQHKSNIATSYHYHLLSYFPDGDYHLATFSYFTSKYCFIVVNKNSETIKIYTGTTSDLSSATLFKTIEHNAASQNVSYGNSFDIEWKGNHIYFRNIGEYQYNRLLNNPTIEGSHYELVETLNCGQLMNGGYGLVNIDSKGNVYMADSRITYKYFNLNKPSSGYNFYYYYGANNTIPDFYAPTAAGTSGQILKSNGGGAPTWDNIASLIGGVTFWTGTQDEYDALGTYSNSIVYLIKEDEE